MRYRITIFLLLVLAGAGTIPAIAQDGGDLLPITADNASDVVELDALSEQNAEVDYLCLAFSPDGTLLAAGDDEGTISLWDVQENALLVSISTDGEVSSLAFSPDGALLASASWDSDQEELDTVYLWDVESGEEVLHLDYAYRVDGVTFSPDGALLATAGAGDDLTVRLWDAETGEEVTVFEGYEYRVNIVAFSPDGSQLATGSRSAVWLWDVEAGEQVTVFEYERALPLDDLPMPGNWVGTGTFERGGQTGWFILSFTVSEDGTTIESPFLLEGNQFHMGTSLFVEDGAFSWTVSTGSDTIRINGQFTSQTEIEGTIVTSIVEATWTATPTNPVVESVVFSPDGSQLASASTDGAVQLWDVEAGTIGSVLGESVGDDMFGVAFIPDGTVLASISLSGALQLWDVASGTVLAELEGHTRGEAVAFSPDGTLLVSAGASDDGPRVRLWGVPEN